MITPPDHVSEPRDVLPPTYVKSRGHKSSDTTAQMKSRDFRGGNAMSLLKPVPLVTKKSPKRDLYPERITPSDGRTRVVMDRFPERSRRRAPNVHHVARLPMNSPNRLTLPPIHRRTNILVGREDIVCRASRTNSWVVPCDQASPYGPAAPAGAGGATDPGRGPGKRHVEFRPDSPQVIGGRGAFRGGRIHARQCSDDKMSPRTAIKSILKKQASGCRRQEESPDALKLPSIERTLHRSAGRFRNSANRWRTRTRTSPGISFTCSKEFAKVFENLERDGELPQIHRKGSNL